MKEICVVNFYDLSLSLPTKVKQKTLYPLERYFSFEKINISAQYSSFRVLMDCYIL